MINQKTEYGIMYTSPLGEVKHKSVYSNIKDLIDDEDDVCLMLIDKGFVIIETQIVYIKNRINEDLKCFIKDFSKMRKYSKNPIVKKYSRIILAENAKLESNKITWELLIFVKKRINI